MTDLPENHFIYGGQRLAMIPSSQSISNVCYFGTIFCSGLKKERKKSSVDLDSLSFNYPVFYFFEMQKHHLCEWPINHLFSSIVILSSTTKMFLCVFTFGVRWRTGRSVFGPKCRHQSQRGEDNVFGS